jgi:hypothetical protein
MPLEIQYDILGFQISVDDIVLVQVLQSSKDLSQVELCLRLGNS